jgi:mono/diheme cytochrome c family protein
MPKTGVQIQVMVGLILVSVLLMIAYSIFDTERAETGAEDQLARDGEFGAFLFVSNCRTCHGLEGRGVQENPQAFPGLPLLVEENLVGPTEIGALQRRFTNTIECGRVGTLMPAWHVDQGGGLTFEQIRQLVILITENPDNSWEVVEEFGLETDEFDDGGIHLAEDLAADATSWEVEGSEEALMGLTKDTRVRIEEEFIYVTDEEGWKRPRTRLRRKRAKKKRKRKVRRRLLRMRMRRPPKPLKSARLAKLRNPKRRPKPRTGRKLPTH